MEGKLSELLSDQFAKVFTCDGLNPELQGPKRSTIDDITFTTNGIVKLLKDLNSEKSSRSDKISAQVLKKCANEVGVSFAFSSLIWSFAFFSLICYWDR